MWPKEWSHISSIIWPSDLVFGPIWPSFNLGRDIIGTNVRTNVSWTLDNKFDLHSIHKAKVHNGRCLDRQKAITKAHISEFVTYFLVHSLTCSGDNAKNKNYLRSTYCAMVAVLKGSTSKVTLPPSAVLMNENSSRMSMYM